MYRLESVSNKLAGKIATELKYGEEKKEVMAYGMFAILQVVLAIAAVAVFGALIGVFWGALIVSFAGAILRRYAGGVHAASPAICIVVGTVVCVGFALLASLAVFAHAGLVIGISAVAFLLCLVGVVKLAPVDSKNKPISEKRKPKMKRGAIIVILIYFAISISLFGLYYAIINQNVLNFTLCLWFGALWQVFTLTTMGEKLLGYLDKLLAFKPKQT